MKLTGVLEVLETRTKRKPWMRELRILLAVAIVGLLATAWALAIGGEDAFTWIPLSSRLHSVTPSPTRSVTAGVPMPVPEFSPTGVP